MSKAMRKVLINTGDGGESYEALYAVHRLREEGYVPVVAAPSKRRKHLVVFVFVFGWVSFFFCFGFGMLSVFAISEANAADYVALLLMGGRAPEYLRNDKKLIALTQEFAKLGIWIFSICHGIQILAAANLLRDKRVTCYEHIRWEVETMGGTWCTEESVRDGRMVSAQTWNSHPEFYREIMNCLRQG